MSLAEVDDAAAAARKATASDGPRSAFTTLTPGQTSGVIIAGLAGAAVGAFYRLASHGLRQRTETHGTLDMDADSLETRPVMAARVRELKDYAYVHPRAFEEMVNELDKLCALADGVSKVREVTLALAHEAAGYRTEASNYMDKMRRRAARSADVPPQDAAAVHSLVTDLTELVWKEYDNVLLEVSRRHPGARL